MTSPGPLQAHANQNLHGLSDTESTPISDLGEKVGNLYQPRGGGSFAIPTVGQHFPKTSSTLL